MIAWWVILSQLACGPKAVTADDPRVATVSQSAVPLDALEAVGPRLASVDVIFLGEATHFDGATMTAKVELVRFLHTELGFDTLAFESDMVSCILAERAGKTGSSLQAECAAGFWTRTQQVQPLLDWLDGEGAGLRLAAFDPQPSGDRIGAELVGELEGFLEAIGSEVPSEASWPVTRAHLDRLVRWDFSAETERRWPELSSTQRLAKLPEVRPPSDERDAFRAALGRVVAEATASEHPERDIWARIVRSVQGFADQEWADRVDMDTLQDLRDAQMARNLLEIADGRKVVAWGATIHGARDRTRLSGGRLGTWRSLGDHVHAAMGERYYALAVTAIDGESGFPQRPYTLGPPRRGSLEDVVRVAGTAPVWVDLRGAPEGSFLRSDALPTRALGDRTGAWSEVVDGVLVLPVQEPIRWIE